MENKMDRDEDMGAHDGMTQGTDMESDDGATTDMAMDRPSMGDGGLHPEHGDGGIDPEHGDGGHSPGHG